MNKEIEYLDKKPLKLGVPKINLNPTQSNLQEIKNWLKQERRIRGEGFFCNWSVIETCFKDKRLITLSYNNSHVGFLAFVHNDFHVQIEIMEIQYEYRHNGLAKYFLNKASEYFKKIGLKAMTLSCEPKESITFWYKMGFIDYPVRSPYSSDPDLYKTLIESKEAKNENLEYLENKIELWNIDFNKFKYEIIKPKPKWTWEIKSEKLIIPIIIPCNYDWSLRWTKNGKIIREDKIKYFCEYHPSAEYKIHYGSFLFIRELKE